MLKLKKPSKTKQRNQRKIDKNMREMRKSLESSFVLISKMEIAAWKAYLIVLFAAGFAAALIWGAYVSWYPVGRAGGDVTMTYHSAVASHKAGDTFQSQLVLNTAGQNIIAIQAVATFDKNKIQVTGIDDSSAASDFATEIAKSIDSEKGSIFIASGRTGQGIDSSSAKIATISFKALQDVGEPCISLNPVSTDLKTSSLAILNDGKGTNVLQSVSYDVPAPPPSDTTPPVRSAGRQQDLLIPERLKQPSKSPLMKRQPANIQQVPGKPTTP